LRLFNRGKNKESALDAKEQLNQFLAAAERRAFWMAKFATGSTDDALDLLQKAMLDFVRRYANRPSKERKPLFYRVLQSRIIDWQRRRSVRKRIFPWLGRGPRRIKPSAASC
jgi:RNA polymerase sigma-70 factor (ECF subfamily)